MRFQMSEEPAPEPNVLKALRLRMYALQKRSDQLAQEARAIATEVADLADALLNEAEPGVGTLKRDDGRLNDAGIAAINAAFENGMGVVQAAKAFGISPSAASTRRKHWLALSAKTGRHAGEHP